MVEIKYAYKTDFDFLGRSGFTQCHGIAVTNIGNQEIFLEAISSRGAIGPCRIPVALASVAALRDALTAILAEPATIAAIGPDPATTASASGNLLALFHEIAAAVADLKSLEVKWEQDRTQEPALVAAQLRLSGLVCKREAILAAPATASL
jgi:hypothetical protein